MFQSHLASCCIVQRGRYHMAIRWAITIQNGNLHPSAVMDVKSVNWQWRELERENRLPERKRDGRVELVKTDLWLQSGPRCSSFWPRTARLDTHAKPRVLYFMCHLEACWSEMIIYATIIGQHWIKVIQIMIRQALWAVKLV